MHHPKLKAFLARRRLELIGLLLGLTALAAVALTLEDIGLTTDEPNYYRSCLKQLEWFSLLREDFAAGRWSAPFQPEVLDRHWNFELAFNVHPPFYKLCSSLSLALFGDRLGPIGAYRFSVAVMFGVLIALIFLSVGRRYGSAAGLWAAGGLLLMPRVFAHAHIGATDLPMTLLWFASALTFHRALERRTNGAAVAFAVVYGLALSTKFTALVIPGPLVLYVLLFRRFRGAVRPVLLALLLGPLLMVALNPQWWHHTFERLHSYLFISASRSEFLYIPTYYLGRRYPFVLPWHHSLVFTLLTVSPLVLAGFLYGLWRTLRRPFADAWATHLALHWIVLHLVMALPGSPGHDGVRLFLPAFAFLAALSGKGFQEFRAGVLPRLAGLRWRLSPRAVAAALLTLMLGWSAAELWSIHPYELSYYNALGGGVRGARRLGMETTYWWDPLNAAGCRMIDEAIPDSAAVYARNAMHYKFLQRLGRIKPSLEFRKQQVGYFIEYHRQGLFNDQDWALIRWGAPLRELKLEGVPLLSVYRHPEACLQALERLKDRREPSAFYDRALLLDMLDQPQAAQLLLREYLRRRPDHFGAVMLMVGYCLESGRPEEALTWLRSVEDRQEDPLLWRFNLGRVHEAKGEIDQALASYHRVLELKRFDNGALSSLGYLHFRRGEYREAARCFETILQVEPYDDRALHVLGAISEALGDRAGAVARYRSLLEISPDHVPTLVNLGGLLQQRQELAEAARCYQRALASDSLNPAANLNLAGIMLQARRYQDAAQHYRRVLALQPEQPEALLGVALLLSLDLQRRGEALELLRRVCRLQPERAELIRRQYILPLEEASERK